MSLPLCPLLILLTAHLLSYKLQQAVAALQSLQFIHFAVQHIYIYLLHENSEFNEKATITGLRVEGVYRAHHTGTLKTHSHNLVMHTPVRIQSIRTNNLPITPHNARLLFFVYLRSRGFVIDRNLASNHGSCRICNLQVATLCQVLIKQQKLL